MTESNLNNHIAIEDLSAFADGQVTDPVERERIERHLAACLECRQELDELRALSQLLSDLPDPELPRSFRLSPEDIPAQAAPTEASIEPWIIRYQSRFRVAAMAAVLLLVAVVTIDVVPSGTEDAEDSQIAMMEEVQQDAAEEEAAEEEAAERDAVQDEAVEEAAPEADEPDAGIMGAEEEDEPVDEEDAPAVDSEADALEDDRDQEAAAPESDADVEDAEDRAVAPADEPADDVSEPQDGTVATETSDGISTLRIVAIVLGVVTALLLAAGFIIPRWWQASARQ